MIPKPIYEFLPYFYVAGGIAAMLLVDSFMSFTSGLLMSTTGVMVLFLRRNYRMARQLFLRQDLQIE